MIRVRLFCDYESTDFLMWYVNRQTPDLIDNKYKNLLFVNDESYTHVVIINHPPPNLNINSPLENNIGFIMEPPDILRPKPNRLDKISKYYTTNENDKEILKDKYRLLPMQVLLFAEILNDNSLLPSNKPHKMSMVVSKKRITQPQQKRLNMANKLINRNIGIHFYGREFQAGNPHENIKGSLETPQKHKALRNYSYSIAFENTLLETHQTEKFQDCIVNNCIPITNNKGAFKYYPENSFIYLNPEMNSTQLADKICEIYNTPVNTQQNDAILEAKEQILRGKSCFVENIYKALNGEI